MSFWQNTAHEKKLARTEGKGGATEVLQDAMKRLKSKEKDANYAKLGTKSSHQQQMSKQSLKRNDGEKPNDGVLVQFLKQVAGYSKNEIVEEKVTVRILQPISHFVYN